MPWLPCVRVDGQTLVMLTKDGQVTNLCRRFLEREFVVPGRVVDRWHGLRVKPRRGWPLANPLAGHAIDPDCCRGLRRASGEDAGPRTGRRGIHEDCLERRWTRRAGRSCPPFDPSENVRQRVALAGIAKRSRGWATSRWGRRSDPRWRRVGCASCTLPSTVRSSPLAHGPNECSSPRPRRPSPARA